MTKPFQRGNWQQILAIIISKSLVNQRVDRFYLQEPGRAAAYRSKDNSKAACNGENPVTTCIAAHKNCLSSTWLTDRREAHPIRELNMTDRQEVRPVRDSSVPLLSSVCSRKFGWSLSSLNGWFLFFYPEGERLGTLANFSFPKQEVCLLPESHRPPLSLLDRKDKYCYSAILTSWRYSRRGQSLSLWEGIPFCRRIPIIIWMLK